MKIIKEDVLLEDEAEVDTSSDFSDDELEQARKMQIDSKSKDIDDKDKKLKDYQTKNGTDIKLDDPKKVESTKKAIELYDITRADGDLDKAGDYAYRAIELRTAVKGSNVGTAIANTIKNILSPGSKNTTLTVFVDALKSENLIDKDNAFMNTLQDYPNMFINLVNDKSTFENFYNSYCDGALDNLKDRFKNRDDVYKYLEGLVKNENTYKETSSVNEFVVNYNKLDDKDKAKVRKAINANNSK